MEEEGKNKVIKILPLEMEHRGY